MADSIDFLSINMNFFVFRVHIFENKSNLPFWMDLVFGIIRFANNQLSRKESPA